MVEEVANESTEEEGANVDEESENDAVGYSWDMALGGKKEGHWL
jgi:hypothetical protein